MKNKLALTDCIFTLIALAFVLRGNLVFRIAAPIVYVIASSYLLRIKLSDLSTRSYFMLIAGSVVGLSEVAGELLNDLAQSLGDTKNLHAQLARSMRALGQAVPHIAAPMATGIALLVICSVWDRSSGPRSSQNSIGQTDNIVGVKPDLQKSVEANVLAIQSAAKKTASSLEAVANQSAALEGSLTKLVQAIQTATEMADSASQCVNQMHHVLDDFSELASHQILKRA